MDSCWDEIEGKKINIDASEQKPSTKRKIIGEIFIIMYVVRTLATNNLAFRGHSEMIGITKKI